MSKIKFEDLIDWLIAELLSSSDEEIEKHADIGDIDAIKKRTYGQAKLAAAKATLLENEKTTISFEDAVSQLHINRAESLMANRANSDHPITIAARNFKKTDEKEYKKILDDLAKLISHSKDTK